MNINVFYFYGVICHRYGENGTISLAGLKRLLQNVGLGRIRTVMVQHHEQPGHHYDHDHSHDHHHHHHHHNHKGHSHHHHPHDDGHQKHGGGEPSKTSVGGATTGKKAESLDTHNKLYDKKKGAVAAQEVEATTEADTPQVAKPAGEEPTAARLMTETQTQATGSHDHTHDHDHEHDHDHDHEHDHEHEHDHDHEHNHEHDHDVIHNRSHPAAEVRR